MKKIVTSVAHPETKHSMEQSYTEHAKRWEAVRGDIDKHRNILEGAVGKSNEYKLR